MTNTMFPYDPRPNQKIILEEIHRALSRNGSIIIESGTGSGKTICALAPSIEYGMKNDKKIIYLTRTNSQQDQIFKELRQIKKQHEIFGIGMQGRQNQCPLFMNDPNISQGSSEELSKLCSDKKKATIDGEKKRGCRYYANLLNYDLEILKGFVNDNTPVLEEFKLHCIKDNICPYEASKVLMPSADVIAAPYIFFFSPMIRRMFLNWMNSTEEDVILIIDEAHNLPDFARELISSDISIRSLHSALNEAKKIGDPQLVEGIRISNVLNHLIRSIYDIIDEYLVDEDEDGLVPPNELEISMMSKFKVTDNELKEMLLDILTHGEIIRESKRKKGKLPRSHLHSIGMFLINWVTMEDHDSAKLVIREGPGLESYGMDPSKITSIVNDCHSSIHLSGTLSPLDEYRDSIGMPITTKMLSLPSPFSEDNRITLYREDVTTKYDVFNSSDEMKLLIRDHVDTLVAEFKKNTLIFFPSYSILSSFKSMVDIGDRRIFYEKSSMSQNGLMDMVNEFKNSTDAILLAVMGGRISEGIDFPGDELEIVVLVGIPFPKPTAKHRSLFEYYERKHARGWEYTVIAPATRKLLQSIGRLIRTENDRGAALILDRRIKQFRKNLPGLRASDDHIREISGFFDMTYDKGKH